MNLTDEEAANIGPDVELAHAQTEQIEPPKEAGASEGAPLPSTDGKGEDSFEKEPGQPTDPANESHED